MNRIVVLSISFFLFVGSFILGGVGVSLQLRQISALGNLYTLLGLIGVYLAIRLNHLKTHAWLGMELILMILFPWLLGGILHQVVTFVEPGIIHTSHVSYPDDYQPFNVGFLLISVLMLLCYFSFCYLLRNAQFFDVPRLFKKSQLLPYYKPILNFWFLLSFLVGIGWLLYFLSSFDYVISISTYVIVSIVLLVFLLPGIYVINNQEFISETKKSIPS